MGRRDGVSNGGGRVFVGDVTMNEGFSAVFVFMTGWLFHAFRNERWKASPDMPSPRAWEKAKAMKQRAVLRLPGARGRTTMRQGGISAGQGRSRTWRRNLSMAFVSDTSWPSSFQVLWTEMWLFKSRLDTASKNGFSVCLSLIVTPRYACSRMQSFRGWMKDSAELASTSSPGSS